MELWEKYKEWIEGNIENIDDGMSGTVCCGECTQEFSEYVGLMEEITFEQMSELEERYNNEVQDLSNYIK